MEEEVELTLKSDSSGKNEEKSQETETKQEAPPSNEANPQQAFDDMRILVVKSDFITRQIVGKVDEKTIQSSKA